MNPDLFLKLPIKEHANIGVLEAVFLAKGQVCDCQNTWMESRHM